MRRLNPALVAMFTLPANRAVDAAMKRWHDENPAGYHWAHQRAKICPFDVECPFGAMK